MGYEKKGLEDHLNGIHEAIDSNLAVLIWWAVWCAVFQPRQYHAFKFDQIRNCEKL